MFHNFSPSFSFAPLKQKALKPTNNTADKKHSQMSEALKDKQY